MFIAGWSKIKKWINQAIWYCKADLIISKSYISSNDANGNRVKKLDSFYFYVKQPLSKSYQYHASIEPTKDNLGNLTVSVEASMSRGRNLQLEVCVGLGTETIFFHRSILNKLLTILKEMLVEVKREGEINVTNQ